MRKQYYVSRNSLMSNEEIAGRDRAERRHAARAGSREAALNRLAQTYTELARRYGHADVLIPQATTK
jgi:hypothetical protein